jgi:putative serine protease PepD
VDQTRAHGPGRARAVEIGAVGLLSALLASGGTYAVLQVSGEEPVVVEAETAAVTGQPTADNASLGTVEDWTGVAEQVSPSVVSIGVLTSSGTGSGSGVVWDGEGHVVTNAHVVAGAREVEVTLADGRTYQAEVVGADTATDLAVLSLENAPDDLTPIEVGDDDNLVVGAPVMAVGNPLGLSGTVTTGIVSALDRPVTTQAADEGREPTLVVTNAIQTSAPINPGNSGGALVDASGRLVGINSAIASLSGGQGGQGGNIGIGFAIPVGKAVTAAEQLIEDGSVRHAFLGVGLEDARAESEGAPLTAAGVSQVEPGSPAEEAGLEPGDAIVEIDGERVDSSLSLVAQVRERTTGDEVTITYVRDGARDEVTVTLDARPDDR